VSPAVGAAQTPPTSPPPARTDSVRPPAHRLLVDGYRLHPTRLVYQLDLTSDSVTRPLGEIRAQVAETLYAAAPAWLLTRSGMQGSSSVSESLYVSRAALRPMHWTAALGAARLAVEFAGDSVYGAVSSPLGKHNIILMGRSDLLVNVGAVDAVLGALSLSSGWHDSASVIVVDGGGSAIAPVTLAVEGEEKTTVPAGEFDCWIVSLESERGAERYWVSKTDQTIVRSQQILPHLGGGQAVLQRTLLRVEPSG
jgi:hypothetical protein